MRPFFLLALTLGGCSPRSAPHPAALEGAPETQSWSSSVSLGPTSSSAPPAANPAPPSASSAEVAAAPPSESFDPACVDVVNVGMHIGGGPNDRASKAPIARAIEPHFDSFRNCAQRAERLPQGDLGVDLRIPASGGKAEVSNLRTALGSEAFRSCVLKEFESVEFAQARRGDMVVSYSLQFRVPPRCTQVR